MINNSHRSNDQRDKQKIGKIIFSRVLEMPLSKYLTYIDNTTKRLIKPSFIPLVIRPAALTYDSTKKKSFMLK
jgi:hypothetical protein